MQIKRRQLPDPLPLLPNCSSLLQRVYAARGIQHESELDKNLEALLPFHSLIDIKKACKRLERAFFEEERILIVGDFDADGATASALVIIALRTLGATSVDFLVPNRFEFGYGLTPGLVEIAKLKKPNLIITVDNGISSFEGIEAANLAGIDVLVTDHHLPAESLPQACAIVNPNQKGDPFLSKSIAGVGVIFYVMLALRQHLSEVGWFELKRIKRPNMAQFLDLVALGTVADVVPLDKNNRIMVDKGLNRIRQGGCRPGILALIEIAGRDYSRLRESDLGFAVAPRLNAAGRLKDMSLGIECLISQDLNTAKTLAARLNELNKERRLIENEMREHAMLMINQLIKKLEGAEGQTLPIGLCLIDPEFHQGVIGILAGRLKERYHRPVIIFALVSSEEIKGSARSIPGLNIRDVLAAIDKDNPGLITKFGGHAMAAGLSLKPGVFSKFRDVFVAEVSRHISLDHCRGEIWTDGPLNASEINLNTALMLEEAGPWGQQFPEPYFNNIFEVVEQRLLGEQHLKLKLIHPEGEIFDGIAFNIDLNKWPNFDATYVDVVYKLNINSYHGTIKLQLLVETLEVIHDNSRVQTIYPTLTSTNAETRAIDHEFV